jgi:hypothetical protein
VYRYAEAELFEAEEEMKAAEAALQLAEGKRATEYAARQARLAAAAAAAAAAAPAAPTPVGLYKLVEYS